MSKRSLRAMVKDPRWISSIYNYCDQWCDRCPLTSRCVVFEQIRREPEPVTFDNLADRVRGDLSEAMVMLQEKADELGVDLSAAPGREEAARERTVRETLDQHPLRRAADDYRRRAGVLIGRYQNGTGDHQQSPATTGTARRGAAGPRLSEDEALRIIDHYHFRIPGKLVRALIWEPFDEEDARSVQNDANGSARVALLAIDRSMEAWFELLHFRGERTDIEDMLERLNALRDDVDRVFPNARLFVRPGFDTGDQPWTEPASSCSPGDAQRQ